ncbi:MAG TPA: hypothetical protein VGZ69_07715 [Candidatus Rhabdochlamydia sp.]|nr:hypothetical protein [Candidatus Rhabdochlamydia sp.]
MKFNRATAFEKHLLEAKKEHLAPVYLVAIPDAYERKRMAEQVAMRISFFYPNSTFTTKEAIPIMHLLDELNTISLFEKNRIIFYDSIQSIKKEELNSLTRYFANPASSTYLLLGISHAKMAQEIYMEGKKDLISCDFTEEKPWDRKDRLKNYLRQFALSRKKKCSLSLIEQLLEKRGMDLAILEQDLEKIITFIGERSTIQEMDLAAICTDQKLANLWQLSDGILFSKQKISLDSEIDISCLLSLIGQMRLQLQRSLEIRILLEKKISHAEIYLKFPTIKKNQLEKLFSFAQEREEKWLIQALHHLFQVEMLAKNSAATPAILLHKLSYQLSN